jgi:hypothetical protein
MKILLSICSIIYAISVFGRPLFPAIFNNLYTFWIINIVLAVLVPIGFAKSLAIYFRQETKNLKSIKDVSLFLLIFFMAILLPITVHHSLNSLKTPVLSSEPMFSIKKTSECNNEENRKWEAEFLFRQYGIKIPYKLDSGEYEIYEPTPNEIKKHNKKLEERKEMLALEMELNRRSRSSSVVATVHIVCFFVFFITTMIYEKKRKIEHNIM